MNSVAGQPQVDWSEAEREMVQEFQTPVVGRRYRQGTMKCFFNYLLIDPRIADVSFSVGDCVYTLLIM